MNMRGCLFASRRFRTITIQWVVIVVFSLSYGSNLFAADNSGNQQPTISLDAAVNTVRNQYADGKVLKTIEENAGTGKIYVIKMITADSRVLHIRVDAKSGKIID